MRGCRTAMDDCLPPESVPEATIRLLLALERARRQEFGAGGGTVAGGTGARQNEVIIRLEQRELQEHLTLRAGLTEQNALLWRQVAMFEQENARLRAEPLARLLR